MHNQKGFTLIELIAVMLIIGVLTATVIPKIIDLESSAEKKLLGTVLSELNAREQLAWLDCKLGPTCREIITNDLMGVSFDEKMKNLIFTGGGEYRVYRTEATDIRAATWSESKPKPPKKDKPPKNK